MTQPEYRTPLSPARSRGARRTTALLGLGLAGLLMGSLGCDTVAKISFPDRRISTVETTGFIAPPDACGAVGANGGTSNLRFVVVDDQTPKDVFTGSDLNAIAADDLGIDSGNIFEAPDVPCDSDSTCDAHSAYQCTIAGDSDQSSLKRCTTTAQYNVDDVRFVSDVSNDQMFGVLMENSYSLNGSFPDTIRDDWYDSDRDFVADARPAVTVESAVASDSSAKRLAELRSMLDSAWDNVSGSAREKRNLRSFFGLWSMNGVGATESFVDRVTQEDGRLWTQATPQASDAVTQFQNQDVTRRRVDIVSSIDTVLDEGFSDDTFSEYDKTLMVFVDGPPDYPAGFNQNVSVQSVIDKANNLGVKLQIIHLDSSIDEEELRDDPAFYNNQETECSSDADCLGWQACREVNGYAPSSNSDILEDPEDPSSPVAANATFKKGKWCMPDRRSEDGRYGPIQMYSRMACTTGGGYQYLRTPTDLEWAMPWMPYVMDGVWEADVEITPFAAGRVEAGAPHRLSAEVRLSANRESTTFTMSQTAEQTATDAEAGDNRPVIFADEKSN